MSCGVPCSCRSRSYRTAPSSTISSVHASCTCIGYAYSVKWAWKTSTTPGIRGRQAETSCPGRDGPVRPGPCCGAMQRTYKTEPWSGRQSRRMSTDTTAGTAAAARTGPLRHQDRRPAAGRPGALAAAERHVVPGQRPGIADSRGDRGAVRGRRRGRLPADVPAAGDGLRGHEGGPGGGSRAGPDPRPAPARSSLPTSSPPATTATTGPRCGRSPRPSSMWWGWRCTGRATAWTRW